MVLSSTPWPAFLAIPDILGLGDSLPRLMAGPVPWGTYKAMIWSGISLQGRGWSGPGHRGHDKAIVVSEYPMAMTWKGIPSQDMASADHPRGHSDSQNLACFATAAIRIAEYSYFGVMFEVISHR